VLHWHGHSLLLLLLGTREAALELLGDLTGAARELIVVVWLSVVVLLRGSSSGLLGSSELLGMVLVELGRSSVAGSHIVVVPLLVLQSWLYDGDELLEESEHLWFLQHLNGAAAEVLPLVVLEVSSVPELLVLSLPDLLNLVVADVELFTVEDGVVEL